MKRFAFPDSLVLVFVMIVLAQLATYVLTPGAFDRAAVEQERAAETTVIAPSGSMLRVGGQAFRLHDDERVVLPPGTREEVPGRNVLPGSWKPVDAEPLPWHSFLTLIPKGLAESADIIFFVFIVGGVIAVVRRTGAIDAVIAAAITKLGSKPVLLTGGMVTLFAIGSSTIGMAEEYMPFIPILVAMCLALRMDAIVAMAIVYVGAGIGYGAASLNPFTVMIAKDIAGQPAATGFGLRWALLLVFILVSVHHIMRYARSIQADPAKSLVHDVDYAIGFEMPEDTQLTVSRMVIIGAMVAMIGLFVWGTSEHGWYLVELAALFFGLALFAAVVGKISPNQTARSFIDGAAELTGTAVLIGFARTIEVVLNEARVIDTVIHRIASLLEHADALGRFASVVSAWGMLIVQSITNFLVPSGSGQAYVTMPIMAPLADLTGVGRETAVLAFQLGDGLTNMIVPTNALLMGMLLLGRIPYQRWLRFALPLLLKIYLIAMAVLAWAALVRYQ